MDVQVSPSEERSEDEVEVDLDLETLQKYGIKGSAYLEEKLREYWAKQQWLPIERRGNAWRSFEGHSYYCGLAQEL